MTAPTYTHFASDNFTRDTKTAVRAAFGASLRGFAVVAVVVVDTLVVVDTVVGVVVVPAVDDVATVVVVLVEMVVVSTAVEDASDPASAVARETSTESVSPATSNRSAASNRRHIVEPLSRRLPATRLRWKRARSRC
jgi:hypothetical protein